MEAFNRHLNDLLVDTFKVIVKIEEVSIRRTGCDLSVSEVHILEAVAKGGTKGRIISDIAEDLRITLPSVTIAINKLVKKGYVQKVKNALDGRMVFVILTAEGQKMEMAHRYFHKHLVSNLAAGLSEEEKESLYKAMLKMNGFFERRLLKERQ
ncbi:MAG: MarR family transcriptional regulator [Clostridia bacterium]|nr:MarR family transcriptional regulator [Clostridia bacterium]